MYTEEKGRNTTYSLFTFEAFLQLKKKKREKAKIKWNQNKVMHWNGETW